MPAKHQVPNTARAAGEAASACAVPHCGCQQPCAVLQVPWKLVAGQLKQLGFEPGWGKNVGIIRETMHLLLDILEVCCPCCTRLLLLS